MLGQRRARTMAAVTAMTIKISEDLAARKVRIKERIEAEKNRRQQLADAWQEIFDAWIKQKKNPQTSTEQIAKNISDETGIMCKAEDVIRRKKFLKYLVTKPR